ncbi:hypothetical protein [Serratia proteamaculans]|uniref:hypothetical protein n=1 Tax=Serratia proteamaculans TaxID=28151 RepID=UPI00217AA1FE|nr:hypothetical protein [Serratia proteamaculans]CAI1179848.1 Uncharacterised protein [Serratia proteamaculans]
MEINIRKSPSYGSASWRNVEVKEDGTKISFDVSVGDELNKFHETLLDAAFGDMEMDEIVSYLTANGYADEIIERYEEEKSEAA